MDRAALTDVLLTSRNNSTLGVGLERIPIDGLPPKNISRVLTENTRRADEKALRPLSSLDVGLRNPASPEAVI